MQAKLQQTKIKPYIIAEMACSHEGRVDLGRQIIDGAGKAGADAIQFQIWELARMMVPDHPEYENVSKIELSRSDWRELADYSRGNYPDMDIIGCVYERSSVDFCQEINLDAYKIHSSDLSNPYLIEYVADTGKRIDLSVGASTVDEIRTAVNWIKARSKSLIWLMYGIQTFPTPADQIHLDFMKTLTELFDIPLGYQDHSDGDSEAAFWLPAYAMGLGIRILEKHITHDRSKKGFDHEAALNPDEFHKFTSMIRTLDDAGGSADIKPFTEEEIKYRKYSKKSLVAAHPLAEGSIINEADLIFMRAVELGLPPDQSGRLIGRRLKHPVDQYHIITEDDLE